MNEEVCYIINKGKTIEWGKLITLSFFELYTVYINKLGQFFFHTYLFHTKPGKGGFSTCGLL